jgi:folate-binding protein YgfZ
VKTSTHAVARRPRAYVRVSGRDAEDLLQRMLSNDVAALDVAGSCDALLLTAKARVIAPLRVWRRGREDFLLLTEPDLGDVLRTHLLKARFAARCEIEPEEHTSVVIFGGAEGIATNDFGVPAVEVLDREVEATVSEAELERLRIEAATPRFGREIDDRVLPAEAGLVERAVSFTKGCYPGQEPIARLRYRGRANRRLAVLELEEGHAPTAETELHLDGKVVGRVTSSVPGLALGYVRKEVEDGASLDVEGRHAKVRPARFELATSASAEHTDRVVSFRAKSRDR